MYPYQWRSGMNIAHHKGNGFLGLAISVRTVFGAKSVDPKLAPASRKIGGRNLLNSR